MKSIPDYNRQLFNPHNPPIALKNHHLHQTSQAPVSPGQLTREIQKRIATHEKKHNNYERQCEAREACIAAVADRTTVDSEILRLREETGNAKSYIACYEQEIVETKEKVKGVSSLVDFMATRRVKIFVGIG